ncbi:cyclin-L1-like isoform X1 [Megalobrama amblycephala]|uniref:cyclin-L1-like isoform X1 n=1 Tax=Megalobrama amblycephala TaxID=75352 RepID=UPI0020141D97|nr:cyclin-L1-like isoform X1 [Megalobrama amblycephala]XP_048037829.1 cyclin-L1-like isoform X1 [Megalobrama amblycephala]XP_048037830.1 cyclin-L1-like isoform X1 [Megalobrama amblycephala]
MAAAAGLILPGDGIMIAGKLYSGVALTLENCLLPPESVHCSPSRAHGLSARTEEQLRIRMCEMIQNAGVLLRLPQVAMATAQILFHRFFYCKSFVRHCAETVAMACLQLASKIEEEPRRVRDVLNVFHHLKHAAGNRLVSPLLLDEVYVSRKSHVIKAERRVLKELGFCVHVKHPHKVIVMYLQVLECEKNTRLLQIAWNYMNDSLRTDVFLRFSAETVACACIFLSARVLQIPLPDQPPWFSLFGTSEQDLIEISCCILRLYTLRCESLTALQQQVEESRLKLDAQYHTSKPGGPASATDTPTRDPAAGFSPASKAASPAENQKNHESPLSHLALKNVCRKITSRDGRNRLSRSDERRSIPSPPRRRRSRSVTSPSRPVSPGRSKSYRHRQREREREQRKGRSSHRR